MKTEGSSDIIWDSVVISQLSNEDCFPIIENSRISSNMKLPIGIENCLSLSKSPIELNQNSVMSKIYGDSPTNTSATFNINLSKENVNVVHINSDNTQEQHLRQFNEMVVDDCIENILFFVCNVCSFLCTSTSTIDEHIDSEHKNKLFVKPLNLKCPVCPNIFLHKLSLKSHLIHDHKVENSDLRKIMQAIIYSSKKCLTNGGNLASKNFEPSTSTDSFKNELDFNFVENLVNSNQIISLDDSNSNDNTVILNFEDFQKNIHDSEVIIENDVDKETTTVRVIQIQPENKNDTAEKFISSCNNKKRTDCVSKFVEQQTLQKCVLPSCKVCLRDKSKMSYHMKCHNGSTFKCPECNEPYAFWKPLTSHLWRFHKVDMELYSCDQCDYKTFSSGKLNNIHKLIHGDLKSFVCDVCQKGFKNIKQLRNHRIIHKDKVEKLLHVCETCTKAFSDRRQLRVHMNSVHNKIKPFSCSYCGYKAASKSAMRMHIRHHTGEKPFACDSCNYSTGDHNSLRRHKLQHTGDKPYKCAYCDYACIQSSTYKVHLKTKHPDLEKDLVFMCPCCQFKTVNQEIYISHMFVVHKQKVSEK